MAQLSVTNYPVDVLAYEVGVTAAGHVAMRPTHKIRLSEHTSGGVDLAPVINAILTALTAGTYVDMEIDVPGSFGATACNFSQPGRYAFGPYEYDFTATTSQINIGPYKDVQVVGCGNSPASGTHLKCTAAVASMFHVQGYDSSTLIQERRLLFSDMNWDGNGVGLCGYTSQGNSGSSYETQQIFHIWDKLQVHGFQTAGIKTSAQEYFGILQFCQVWGNVCGFWSETDADMLYLMNMFGGPTSTTAQLVIHGSQQRIIQNDFLCYANGVTSGTGPDIEIRTKPSGAGTIVIDGNYFGSEGESNSRVKIRFKDVGNPSDLIADVMLNNNWFYGLTGQTAVEIDNPTSHVVFGDANIFYGFSTIINDANGNGASGTREGHNVFHSRVESPPQTAGIACKLFANGGRGFDDVIYPPSCNGITLNGQVGYRYRNRGANQRLKQSDAWTTQTDGFSWLTGNGAAYTGGQSDPFGGTAAGKITKTAGQGFTNAAKQVVMTSLLTDTGEAASGSAQNGNGRIVVDFWAKAGSLSSLDLALYDASYSKTLTSYHLPLSTAWRPFRFVLAGLNPANVIQLLWYPGLLLDNTGGDIYLSHVQVSDFGADYTNTSTF